MVHTHKGWLEYGSDKMRKYACSRLKLVNLELWLLRTTFCLGAPIPHSEDPHHPLLVNCKGHVQKLLGRSTWNSWLMFSTSPFEPIIYQQAEQEQGAKVRIIGPLSPISDPY